MSLSWLWEEGTVIPRLGQRGTNLSPVCSPQEGLQEMLQPVSVGTVGVCHSFWARKPWMSRLGLISPEIQQWRKFRS